MCNQSKLYSITCVAGVCWSLVPQPTVTITRNHSDSILAGTGLVLTANISFSDQNRVNVDKSLDIFWRRGNDVIVNDSHITISAVSGNGDSYTASLTYSPITISDSGQITAIVTVRPKMTYEYIRAVNATASVIITGIETYLYLSITVIKYFFFSSSSYSIHHSQS